jgi:radical SAM protein with 4Fe4S-binding SPASM domain
MDLELFKQIIIEATNFAKVEQITLTGYGEPLLCKYLIEEIRTIKSYFTNIEVVITTNGTLLTKEIGKELIDSGLDAMNISLNAATHDRYVEFNNSDKYEQLENNVIEFLKMLNQNNVNRTPKTFVQVLETVNSKSELEQFAQKWNPLVYPNARVTFHPMCNWGGEIEVGGYKKKKQRYPCDQLQHTMIISREGTVTPCCAVLPEGNGDLILGNVKDKSLKEMFTQGKILELRRMDLEGRMSELKPCATCDSWQIAPNAFFRNPLYPLSKRLWL